MEVKKKYAEQHVEVHLIAIDSKTAVRLLEDPIKAGENELNFQTFDLPIGSYMLNIVGQSELLLRKKIVIEQPYLAVLLGGSYKNKVHYALKYKTRNWQH